jgi:hypothetical protein
MFKFMIELLAMRLIQLIVPAGLITFDDIAAAELDNVRALSSR